MERAQPTTTNQFECFLNEKNAFSTDVKEPSPLQQIKTGWIPASSPAGGNLALHPCQASTFLATEIPKTSQQAREWQASHYWKPLGSKATPATGPGQVTSSLRKLIWLLRRDGVGGRNVTQS